MDTLAMIFIVIAAILFFGAALRIMADRVDLGWLGMFFLTLGAFIFPLLK